MQGNAMQTVARNDGGAAQRLIQSLEADGEPTRGITSALAHAAWGMEMVPDEANVAHAAAYALDNNLFGPG